MIERVKNLLVELEELTATYPDADYLYYCFDCGIGFAGLSSKHNNIEHNEHALICNEIYDNSDIRGAITVLAWLLR